MCRKSLHWKGMARPERFELPTFWFVGGFCATRQPKPAYKNQQNQRENGIALGSSRLVLCTPFTDNYTDNLARVYSGAQQKTKGANAMMMDWNEYHKQIGGRLGELMKLSPDTLRGYRMLSDANAKEGHLDAKTRELISLAVAVSTHCDGCIVVHTDAALKAGASKEEISEALGVAVAMNAGAALIYSTRVLDAVEAKTQHARSA